MRHVEKQKSNTLSNGPWDNLWWCFLTERSAWPTFYGSWETAWQKEYCITHTLLIMRYRSEQISWQKEVLLSLTSCWSWGKMRWNGVSRNCSVTHSLLRDKIWWSCQEAKKSLTRCWSWNFMWWDCLEKWCHSHPVGHEMRLKQNNGPLTPCES